MSQNSPMPPQTAAPAYQLPTAPPPTYKDSRYDRTYNMV